MARALGSTASHKRRQGYSIAINTSLPDTDSQGSNMMEDFLKEVRVAVQEAGGLNDHDFI